MTGVRWLLRHDSFWETTVELDLDNTSERTCSYFFFPLSCCDELLTISPINLTLPAVPFQAQKISPSSQFDFRAPEHKSTAWGLPDATWYAQVVENTAQGNMQKPFSASSVLASLFFYNPRQNFFDFLHSRSLQTIFHSITLPHCRSGAQLSTAPADNGLRKSDL